MLANHTGYLDIFSHLTEVDIAKTRPTTGTHPLLKFLLRDGPFVFQGRCDASAAPVCCRVAHHMSNQPTARSPGFENVPAYEMNARRLGGQTLSAG